MGMVWADLLFAHWRVDAEALRAHIPAGLELDTYDGDAWLGVVPFRMENVRHRLAPALPGLRAFPELNLRTYVTAGGEKPGVYFFSLDATNRAAIETARATFGLNYLKARMRCEREGDSVAYTSERTDRRGPSATLRCSYRGHGDVFCAEAGSLEDFLTSRYCLYAERKGRVRRGEIHHEAWRLRRASWECAACDMTRLVGMQLDREPDSLLVAERIDVVAWLPERV